MEEYSYIKTINIDKESLPKIFGPLDIFAKKIQKIYSISLIERNGEVKIMGRKENVERVYNILSTLLSLSISSGQVTEQNVDYTIAMNETNDEKMIIDIDKDIIAHTSKGQSIKAKTVKQKEYVDSIRKNMITFSIGPAGTGKTYLAMAVAVSLFKKGEVNRIILTRPAIEAGEKLGFLPGDLQSKVDPYLRPLYDALYQILGMDSFQSNLEKGLIEVAPLAYMRGRTLDNAFIILDEAQNTTASQMKMFLTRIGFNSKVVITGDETQKDLDTKAISGLDQAKKVLKNIEGIEFIILSSKDVVRHPLVQKIVKAYDNFEHRKQK
ncbi:MAG: PhoH family protein [Eubacteriales bacterium]|nr:PhoH family protein [Eubacteriales bacterium]